MPTKTNAKPKTGKRPNTKSAVKPPKVIVGEEFTANDVKLADDSEAIEPRAKALTTTILVTALIVFYAVYIAHEWLTGHSMGTIGRFLENAIFMIIGWCVGKIPRNRSGPES